MISWLDWLTTIDYRACTSPRAWCTLLMLCALGCMDGPLHALKRANPVFHKQRAADRALGPTYSDRMAELKLLDDRIAGMTPQAQSQWVAVLSKLIEKEPSAEMRAHAALVISRVNLPEAQQSLNLASTDEIEKVRIAACKAWRKQPEDAARTMLLNLARSDDSVHVRQAAIESLASFDSPDTRAAMVELLDDRSPAIQLRTALALQEITGRNYGGDFEAWKKFIGGEDVPEPPSSTARLIDAIPLIR